MLIEEDQIEAPIEQEIQEQSESPPSIRESLASALAETKAKQKSDEPEEPAKLVKEVAPKKAAKAPKEAARTNKEDVSSVAPTVAAKAPVAEAPSVKMPHSVPKSMADEWGKLSRPMQEWMAKRETEIHGEITRNGEERQFGQQVRELALPYVPLIRAEGGEIIGAFKDYLNTAYQLRTATPQAKGQLLLQLAKQFGADLRGAVQPQANSDPRFNEVLQKVQTLESTLHTEREAKKQQEDSAIRSQVDAFATDPAHPHYEEVKADMAALLRGGIAKDLQDAYDRAVYSNPQTRSTLLAKQAEEKRVADEKKAKADKARNAGSSLRGGPGPSALKNGAIVQPDLRKALRSAFAEHRGEA